MKRPLTLVIFSLLSFFVIGGTVYRASAAPRQRPVATVPSSLQTPTGTIVSDAKGATLDDPEDNAKEDSPEDQQEDAQLQPLAKITSQQAAAIASGAVSGTVSQISLDNEDGTLVYKVMVGQSEVLVDAGNGAVLETEIADHESANDIAPAGSIRLPDENQGAER